jgi:adenosylcobyric acid synthase
MMTAKRAFLIAAPTSGSGKTTVARGLMALLNKKGYKVQPFKCGPDYIDTKFHEAVCGRPSINLDTFMATPEHVRELFWHYAADADICIVEGMMGLFDGYDREKGSSYEIAQILDIPVVLVVDAKSAAYSMAALLSGFIHFRKDIRIAGVIYNKVGSEKHFQMLRQVCDDLDIACLGYLPKNPSLEQNSRYLGLDFSEMPESDRLIKQMEEHINLQELFNKVIVSPPEFFAEQSGKAERGGARGGLRSSSARLLPSGRKNKGTSEAVQTTPPKGTPPNLGGEKVTLVARNAESFSFLYQETLDRFPVKRFFDPEKDVPDFAGIDLLYLPGGYPEKHLEALVQNEACRKAIKDYAEQGGHIIAECGGMMYLCERIVTDDGDYPMCGVLPYSITARKSDRKLSLGYRRFELDGKEYRGHEFHYTQFLTVTVDGDLQSPSRESGICNPLQQSVCQVYNAKSEPVSTPVFKYKNVLASYTHLYMPPKFLDKPGGKAERGGGLHPIMFAGTGSDVGKSIVAAAFCRIFKQDGYHPAPFKAQNMALNSYATPDGLEIGRAQAVQAEAAGIPCHTDMNPLLLKPQSDHTSQVILNGRPLGNKDAYDYWRKKSTVYSPHSEVDFRKEVCSAFDRLAARYSPIVMEGAGSIAEINLKDRDLVNMSMARHAKADVILVGDIDRGGVFASVYGSISLQSPEDRKLIKGIIINKFRGDMRLFEEGRKMLEDLCGIPVLGVIPYYKDIHIEEEDSVALAQKSFEMQQGKVNVAVIMLQHLSNYTDFDALEQDPRIHLFYTNNVDDIHKADIIILPGTKSTLHDLYELRRNGCAQAIIKAHRNGASVLGICGGYQLMGIEVCDPNHVEGDIERLPGLGLLPVTTTMSGEKVTRQASFSFASDKHGLTRTNISECQSASMTEKEVRVSPCLSDANNMRGYEIHMGQTQPFGSAQPSPLLHLSDGRQDGYIVDNRCMGTYVHGILDNAPFVDFLLQPFAEKLSQTDATFDYQAFKEEQYDKLADHVRQHVDMQRIYQILTNG